MGVISLLSLPAHGWSAYITCPPTPYMCQGTEADDVMYGSPSGNGIDGHGGNDYIKSVSSSASSFLWGGDGDDTLIGAEGDDTLQGGDGNDHYDGRGGSDTIIEPGTERGTLIVSNDTISGGEGDDIISSGFGSDNIQGGPGNDTINANGQGRDFYLDLVNCGAGTGDYAYLSYSGDNDTSTNCEFVDDPDR